MLRKVHVFLGQKSLSNVVYISAIMQILVVGLLENYLTGLNQSPILIRSSGAQITPSFALPNPFHDLINFLITQNDAETQREEKFLNDKK